MFTQALILGLDDLTLDQSVIHELIELALELNDPPYNPTNHFSLGFVGGMGEEILN